MRGGRLQKSSGLMVTIACGCHDKIEAIPGTERPDRYEYSQTGGHGMGRESRKCRRREGLIYSIQKLNTPSV